MKRILLIVSLSLFALSFEASAQTQLAAWTFELAATPVSPNTPTSFPATLGTQSGTATLYANGTQGSSLWAQAGELNSFGGTITNDPRGVPAASNALALVNQSANGKAVVFKFSMTGFKDPILTFAAQRTATGFTTQTWAWSTDGTSFTDFTTINSLPAAFGTTIQTVNLAAVNALDGASFVYLKATMTGATSAGGNNRLDNFVLNATTATPPDFTPLYPKAQNITTTSFDGIVNITTASTAYAVVLPDGASAPSSAQVKAGQDAASTPLASNLIASLPVAASGTNYLFTISGLTSLTAYDVYFVAENGDGLMANPVKVDVTTLDASDVIPPNFFAFYPDVTAVAFSSFTFRTGLNEPGRTYFVVLPNNATAPTSAQVKNGTDASNAAVKLKGTVNVNAISTEYTSAVTGLTASTSYDIYVVSEDNIPNLQSSPVKIDVTTQITPYVENFDACNGDVSSFSQVSVSGVHFWDCSSFGNNTSNGVQINAGTGTGSTPNEDWLISPQLTLGSNASVSFDNRKEFQGFDITLKISVNYDGTDPTTASWNDLPFIKSTGAFVSSGVVDLTLYAGLKAYIAIIYTSGSVVNTGARWTIDNFMAADAVPSYLITSVNKVKDFGYVAFPNTSAAKTFTIQGQGITSNLTATAPANFELSKNGTTFSSSIGFTPSEIINVTTVFVRFKPTAAGIGFINSTIEFASGAFLKGVKVSGVEGIDARLSTFDVTTYNLEFFGTDTKNGPPPGGVEFGPTNDPLQIANVTSVMEALGSDIYGLEEVADDAAFSQLVSNLPGYAGILSPKWSYSFQPPDQYFPPQKLGFIYNTSTVQIVSSRVMFSKLYDDILANTVTLPGYPGGTSSSFWSSGRLPFMVKADVTINGITNRVIMVDIHAKSGSAAADYNRRVYDVKVLHDSLIANYPNDKIILLGDYNDDVDGSIYTGNDSSYKIFVDDATNFNTLTFALTQTSASTFPSSGSFLDHIIISDDLTSSYNASSIFIEDPSSYIASYSSTTSDHLPVTARFTISKTNQTITFDPLADKNAGDAPITLLGFSSSGLPITYVSSNTAVATISGGILTIVGAGSTIITASQAGNSSYNPAADLPQSLLVNPGTQTITFNALPSKEFGTAPFALTGVSSSGLTVTYVSSNLSVATISGNTLTITGPGTSTITASQAGNASFGAATPVDQALVVTFGNQTITFNALPTKTFGDAPFALTATASSGLPVAYVSSNTSVATIAGSTVTIVAAGNTTITASQGGSGIGWNPAPDVPRQLIVNVLPQIITFPVIADRTLGDPAFALGATSSAGLTISYSTANDKITLAGSTATIVKAGRATITASQAGNGSVPAATPVDRSFCINPVKPIVSSSNLNTETPILTSNSTTGNQWYKNGTLIVGATNTTLSVTSPGIYKVQVKADDCVSAFSSDIPIIVTGDIASIHPLIAYPNPATNYIEVKGLAGEIYSSQVIDVLGKTSQIVFQKNADGYRGNVEDLSAGIYLLRIQDGNSVHQVKFVKK
ncbi:hypothetical protein BH09BAC3_BH09BAC3_05420 [soil metagenome]